MRIFSSRYGFNLESFHQNFRAIRQKGRIRSNMPDVDALRHGCSKGVLPAVTLLSSADKKVDVWDVPSFQFSGVITSDGS
jgi:hypothetical protein